MRQIKFRGRMKRTKQWMYGDLAHVQGQPCIQVDVSTDEKKTVGMNVDPETVGQFTCLHDINGREIYEGDIVTLGDDGLKCIIDYHEFLGMFYLKWIDDRPQSINDDKSSIGMMQKLYDIEVIGNVHDNPELLNEGE